MADCIQGTGIYWERVIHPVKDLRHKSIIKIVYFTPEPAVWTLTGLSHILADRAVGLDDWVHYGMGVPPSSQCSGWGEGASADIDPQGSGVSGKFVPLSQ